MIQYDGHQNSERVEKKLRFSLHSQRAFGIIKASSGGMLCPGAYCVIYGVPACAYRFVSPFCRVNKWSILNKITLASKNHQGQKTETITAQASPPDKPRFDGTFPVIPTEMRAISFIN
jgi:hypothetical protein